jgi:hypothetical protein
MRAPLRASLAAVAVALVALTSLAAPASAGSQVPFKGRLQGLENNTVNFPNLSVHGEGTGNATKLGRYTVEYDGAVNLITGSGTGFAWLFTAANGDTVTAVGSGQADVPPIGGVLHIEEHGTITGGTGRFAGATGSFTVDRVATSATGVTTGSFEGTISSPGASKH